MKISTSMLLAALLTVSHNISSHDSENTVSRKILSEAALPDLPSHSLTSVSIELPPGISVPPHQHEGLVYVHVIKGTVLSQLNQAAAVVYHAGDSWIENPGDLHSTTKNMSNTESVKMIAVFVSKNGAALTTSGKIEQSTPAQ